MGKHPVPAGLIKGQYPGRGSGAKCKGVCRQQRKVEKNGAARYFAAPFFSIKY
jgi:hypothetical protein